MLSNLTILNHDVLINKGKILPEMSNIGGGVPRKIWKGNLMGYKLTIQPIKMIDGLNKTEEEIIIKSGMSQRKSDCENSTESSGN